MEVKTFLEYAKRKDFKNLFEEILWWNKVNNSNKRSIKIDEEHIYELEHIVSQSGYEVYVCNTDKMPSSSISKRIVGKLKNENYFIIIFCDTKKEFHHIWQFLVDYNGKKDSVLVEYTNETQSTFLAQKLDQLFIDRENKYRNENITFAELKAIVNKEFSVNAEKITKDFYTQFKKEHDKFADFIKGIPDDADKKDRQHYASVMLNRLMFLYFVQKKGFFWFGDNNGNFGSDVHYLHNRFKEHKEKQQEATFMDTFFKGFLKKLFGEFLNAPHNTQDTDPIYGLIPYLNGGLFDEHQIEKQYAELDIEDDAFESLFKFFDKWNWHLDTRITASGRDINPDVLGYIFEQYINDRAQMGAYYTKEDITEYISKNCIIPFLFDKVLDKNNEYKDYVFSLVKNSGDKYIYQTVKKGYSNDWRSKIPQEIADGLNTQTPNLLERRSHWNEKAPEEFALPTEIWRETIERFKRCDDILSKIQNGEITAINDFITYNLDIRNFTLDVINQSDNPSFVRKFFDTLQTVTILDPTCGSGAFLFAGMNILEPLYESCYEWIEKYLSVASNTKLRIEFDGIISNIKQNYKSNIQYYIYKTIILNNLYGVDIMQEAVEIAKLRLFLKMVAVVDAVYGQDNLGLDPLPDIDFNIRCGNTLVGYATQKDIEKAYENGFNQAEFREKIEEKMNVVSLAFKSFRDLQMRQGDNNSVIKSVKKDLTDRLAELNKLLNKLHYGILPSLQSFEDWQKTNQPFHWIAEFYSIIEGNKGFDVIIGNPPYVEHSSNDFKYSLSHLESAECGNLYGNCIERGLSIGSKEGKFSFIIPVAITCSKRMEKVISMLKKETSCLLFANFDDRPGKLFEMIEHLRATIFIASRSKQNIRPAIFATKYNRWYTEHRGLLFNNLCYIPVGEFVKSFIIPKFSYSVECSINRKLQICKSTIATTYTKVGNNKVYYRAAGGGYFLLIKNQKSTTYIDGNLEEVKAEKSIAIDNEYSNTAIGALLSSSLFYWNYIGYTDCRNLTKSFIDNFHFIKSIAKDTMLINSGNKLFENFEVTKYTKNTTYKSTGRNVIYDEYYPKLSKPIIDEIDKILAKHYGFTEEELDFIINYDIKYRMGDELDGGE